MIDENVRAAFVATLNTDGTVTISCVKEGQISVEEALYLGQNFARYIADGMNIPIDMFVRALRDVESQAKDTTPLITRVM